MQDYGKLDLITESVVVGASV